LRMRDQRNIRPLQGTATSRAPRRSLRRTAERTHEVSNHESCLRVCRRLDAFCVFEVWPSISSEEIRELEPCSSVPAYLPKGLESEQAERREASRRSVRCS